MQTLSCYPRYNNVHTNKSSENNKKLKLYAPKGICWDRQEEFQNCSYNGTLKWGGYWEECWLDLQSFQMCGCKKAAVYELLRTGMVDGPAQVFTRYHEKDTTCIRSHVHVKGYNANLYCSNDVMPCGKDSLVIRSHLIKRKLKIFWRIF